jgi:hypothetical protein
MRQGPDLGDMKMMYQMYQKKDERQHAKIRAAKRFDLKTTNPTSVANVAFGEG